MGGRRGRERNGMSKWKKMGGRESEKSGDLKECEMKEWDES